MDCRTGKIYSQGDLEAMKALQKKMAEMSDGNTDPRSIDSLIAKKIIKPMQIHPSINQRRAGKIGRNETCPCGSGRKFKKCCLLKA